MQVRKVAWNRATFLFEEMLKYSAGSDSRQEDMLYLPFKVQQKMNRRISKYVIMNRPESELRPAFRGCEKPHESAAALPG